MRISIATVCSVAIFALPSVTAWGTVAHKTIGLIAKQFLTKEGSTYVDAYLHQQSMDSIGSWADTERESYEGYDAAEYRVCLSSAIAWHNKILMESTSPDDPGAEDSLKYIIHYLSDVCQPLHANGYDKGGSLTMALFGPTTLSLHRIWDARIPHKRVRDDFQDNPVLMLSRHLICRYQKAGLRVAHWINELARLNPQTAVEAATPPTAQPGTSNIEKSSTPTSGIYATI
ncbi:hypothetical protein BASA60_009367 [Batrachochytrium salamandrivorans]|nr:hypothetical protein BASA60_009367 [Batrachochytrium salamandrivorans]